MKHHSSLTRLRTHKVMRELLSNVVLNPTNFMQIIFVDENLTERKPIPNMEHFWIDSSASICETILQDTTQGINSFLLFCVAKEKSKAIDFTCQTIHHIKQQFGNKILLACDLCLCGITNDGHCGFLDSHTHIIDNHHTVEVLANYALEFAKAGADCIAPSDMRDGRVNAIRTILNENDFDNISIMSYSTKFASNYYSAFRAIYNSGIDISSPLQDRKTYQISPNNQKDAVLASIRDEAEGADILMVKPIVRYLDIVKDVRKECLLPIAGFHVSTECVSLNLLAASGYGTLPKLFMEDWLAIKRAGVDVIISYTSRMVKQWINEI